MKPEHLLDDLKSNEGRIRRQTIRDLPDTTEPAILHSVCAVLNDQDPAVREAAIDYLSRCADQSLLASLVLWLQSDDRTGRNAAMDLLIRMADRIYLPLAEDHLLLLKDEALKNALDVLAHVSVLTAADARLLTNRLLRLLQQHPDANIIGAAIQVIGDLGLQEAVSHLEPFLVGPPWLQMNTICALEKIGNDEAKAVLSEALQQSFPESVRVFLVRACRNLGLMESEDEPI